MLKHIQTPSPDVTTNRLPQPLSMPVVNHHRAQARQASLAIRSRQAMTLIELLVVITIIGMLVGLLFPAIAAVRNSANRAATESMIRGLFLACEVYSGEDRQHRYPPTESDSMLRTRMTTGGAPLALDLMRNCGLEWRIEQVSSVGTGQEALVDPWSRGYRYVVDLADGTVVKPAAQADWNVKNIEPYPYIWSLGRPTKGGEASDALSTNADNWLYKRMTP